MWSSSLSSVKLQGCLYSHTKKTIEKVSVKRRLQTWDKMKTEAKIKYQDQIRIKRRFGSVLTCTSFLAFVRHYIINLEFLNSPLTKFLQGPELIIILCILPLFMCRHFWILFTPLGLGPTNSCSAFPSTSFYRQNLKNFQTTEDQLVVLNGLGIVRSTRQAKHDSTTTGRAKLVSIEPSLWKTFNLCTRI